MLPLTATLLAFTLVALPHFLEATSAFALSFFLWKYFWDVVVVIVVIIVIIIIIVWARRPKGGGAKGGAS